MSSIADCTRELKRFLPCVFEKSDLVEVRRLLPPTGRSRKRRAESTWCEALLLLHEVPVLLQHNSDGHDIYVGANPRKAKRGTTSADVALARCIFCDWDEGADLALARNRWEAAGLPEPTLTLHSGHGIHAYWRFVEPLADPAMLVLWKDLQGELIKAVGSDPKPKDLARIMRLPGFGNCKYEARVPCRVVDADPKRRYSLESLVEVLMPDSRGHFTEQYEQTEQSEEHGAKLGKQTQKQAITSAALAKVASTATPQESGKAAIEAAIRGSLPTRTGQRHDCLFVLARKLKAIPALASADGADLEFIVRDWFEQAKSTIATQDFYTSLSEFITAWNRVKFAHGMNPMAVARNEAEREDDPECAQRFEDDRLRLLVRICRALQRYAGDGPFYLGCRTAAEQLGISHTQAAVWLRLLCQLGILRLVEPAERKDKRANRYRYLHDLCPIPFGPLVSIDPGYSED